jgi:taurine dioxygenase
MRALQPFGVEIEGIDVAKLSAGDVERLIETIARHRVAVFRDQHITDIQLVDFLARMGDLCFTAGETPVDGVPQLNIVSNIGRTVPPRSVFHTDTSYVAKPPAFTALRAVLLPAAGGSTLFSDQVRAARKLAPRAIDWLRGRTLVHAVKGPDGTSQAVRHPVVRRHPLTGETALFLSTPERCGSISGVDEVTSARIVSALYRHSIRSAGLYRHQWRARDLVIWDDRTTMHRADHDGVVGNRVLHRGLVAGETPIAA